jgi:hypothetical protein
MFKQNVKIKGEDIKAIEQTEDKKHIRVSVTPEEDCCSTYYILKIGDIKSITLNWKEREHKKLRKLRLNLKRLLK